MGGAVAHLAQDAAEPLGGAVNPHHRQRRERPQQDDVEPGGRLIDPGNPEKRRQRAKQAPIEVRGFGRRPPEPTLTDPVPDERKLPHQRARAPGERETRGSDLQGRGDRDPGQAEQASPRVAKERAAPGVPAPLRDSPRREADAQAEGRGRDRGEHDRGEEGEATQAEAWQKRNQRRRHETGEARGRERRPRRRLALVHLSEREPLGHPARGGGPEAAGCHHPGERCDCDREQNRAEVVRPEPARHGDANAERAGDRDAGSEQDPSRRTFEVI